MERKTLENKNLNGCFARGWSWGINKYLNEKKRGGVVLNTFELSFAQKTEEGEERVGNLLYMAKKNVQETQ